jgi:cohesin loading factor subunit SCC2
VVRKRVIKLLKTFYSLTEDSARRVDIVTRLVLRMGDEDDTVKELAIRTVEELWFNNYLSQFSSQKSKELMSLQNTHDKSPLLAKVVVIMGVSANFKDRQSPLEDLLHKLMADKEGNEAVSLHARYAEICEALIDGLVDASDLPGFVCSLALHSSQLMTGLDCDKLHQDHPPLCLSAPSHAFRLKSLDIVTVPEECHECMVYNIV